MVVAVFRSRLRAEHADEFQHLSDRMLQIAQSMPGFISCKVYAADDGERCTVVEFASADLLRAWREQPEHREAQRLGRERFYEEYTLQVSEPARESRFKR